MNDLSSAPPPGGESPGPGSRLQREREKRGLSVIEAAEKLHLDASVVEALESNRFAAVGPSQPSVVRRTVALAPQMQLLAEKNMVNNR